MAANVRTIGKQFSELFGHLSTGQKTSLFLITGITILAIISLLVWANRPQYTILFSDLSNADAAKIRDHLQDGKVSYRLENGGATILVPQNRVYDLRLQLAADGIPAQPGVGYEIFDRTNLGVSDFVQKLNYKRALEGELARTISSLAEVEQARVHVVIPEPSLFKEDEKSTTASVVLKLKSRSRLGEDQIRGISTLVARSVEGLEPENVTILDSFGNLLSGATTPESGVMLSSTQLELQHKTEAHLAAKAQSMLDGVLGAGHSIVRVNAELNFQQLETTRESYDPESAVIRSEERMESTSEGVDSPQIKEENLLSNYEINKTVEHIVNSCGSINRLSAAVIVDGVYKQQEDGKVEYLPRSEGEMSAIANLVKGALGVRSERGDVLEITNLAFNKFDFQEQRDSWALADNKDLIVTLLPKIILGVVLLVLVLMVRNFLKTQLQTTRKILLERESQPQLTGSTGNLRLIPGQVAQTPQFVETGTTALMEPFPEIVQEETLKKKQIAEFTNREPETSAMLLRTWLVGS
ncbi:MAG: flagellar basal-body MS-ring/collar protein FliF [bacterium]